MDFSRQGGWKPKDISKMSWSILIRNYFLLPMRIIMLLNKFKQNRTSRATKLVLYNSTSAIRNRPKSAKPKPDQRWGLIKPASFVFGMILCSNLFRSAAMTIRNRRKFAVKILQPKFLFSLDRSDQDRCITYPGTAKIGEIEGIESWINEKPD